MNRFKNQLYWLLFMIQSLIHATRMLLFRAYLLLLFAMRMGGAIVIGAAAGGAFYALERMEANLLSALPVQAFASLQQFRDTVLSADLLVGIYDPGFVYGYEIVSGMIAVGVFLALRVVTRIIAPVVYAFPMPRRPLAPVLRWIPPEHTIHAVKAAIAAPRRRNGAWDGDWQKVAARLPVPLQAVMRSEAPLSRAGRLAMPVMAERPAAPPEAPATPSAGRGRYIPPGGRDHSPMPS